MLMFLPPLLLLLPALCHASPESTLSPEASLNIHHRLYHPTHLQPAPSFVPLGSLVAASDRTNDTLIQTWSLQPSSKVSEDFGTFAEHFKSLPKTYGELDFGRTTYQLALEREGDTQEAHWHVTEVKACHITPSSTATLYVHLDAAGKPFAVDFFVSPVPHDGSCPRTYPEKGYEPEPPVSPAFSQALLENATLVVKHTASAPVPELRAPPQLAPGGEPVKPPVEESFFSKYWLYGLGIIIALMLSGGGPEEKGAGGGGGSSSK